MTLFIGLDLETTGLDPKVDQILEIYARAFDPESLRVEGEFHAVIKPDVIIADMVPFVREMHTRTGLLDECVSRGIPLEDALYDLRVFLAQFPRGVLFGRNVGTFDRMFLEAASPGITKAQHYGNFDLSTMILMNKLFAAVDLAPSKELLVEHRAKDDVLRDIHIFSQFANFFEGYA